ncbi:DNA polymerase domain-containing protein [Leptospira sp. id769339]|uniref:DNA polymerase domain-containing protein n=1 Tax=Leptospira sp. id769339 TaxID=2864221 RepID=UPI00214B19EE|nr:DNA polymerase domain-containing protein [Leptospira sp. id769339]MCR1795360.1 DNA polymerase [Leptospira sp. id769339]
METFNGFVFDVYSLEETIYLWIKGESEIRLFTDTFYPSIYISGEERYENAFLKRLLDLHAVYGTPERVIKTSFYENRPREVLKITLSKPSVLQRIYRKLYAFYEKLEIFHSDLEVTNAYMLEKNIFPIANVKVTHEQGNIRCIECLSNLKSCDYKIPDFSKLQMFLKHNHRIGYSASNPLVFSNEGGFYAEVFENTAKKLLHRINEILSDLDPDIILSAYGDQAIFPFLFSLAEKTKVRLLFDRDPNAIQRKIITKGTTFETYGQVIYKAPSYPLFGRLHIDSSNSFVFKESFLLGILELARLSRLPIQRMARASTGTALTCIETDVAIRKKYLVPWQKAAIERPKTAFELLQVDKGGLVYLPDTSVSVRENVAQLDFSQMYPSIMAKYNISPECINCPCCENDTEKILVPETSYHICTKRRGVVSDALEDILIRRKFYKTQIEESIGDSSIYDARQNALKWMLVTSFGYLGYRNAKFGRLESHESVTAIGREVLLLAKEVAEANSYVFLHAITDSLFISKKDSGKFSDEELKELCSKITEKTKIEMKVEGVYEWLIFPASKQDSKIGVVNRYFGKFTSGKTKIRGVFIRRKDTPLFVKAFQTQVLEVMATASTKGELISKKYEIESIYDYFVDQLYSGKVQIPDLFLRRSISKSREEYSANNASSATLNILYSLGIQVEPGEKVKYLVVREVKNKRSYLPEEAALTSPTLPKIHFEFYRELLIQALEELLEHILPLEYFRSLRENQLIFDFPIAL